jgi:poly-beta-1,6-N-acetyl-D-glucosamine synthase
MTWQWTFLAVAALLSEWDGVRACRITPRVNDLQTIMPTLPSYVLITPARNEADYIELTMKSMLAQTWPPIKWVIVSDGSTDSTDDIVRKYAADCPWIELVQMPERPERNFAGKAHAVNAGREKVAELHYDVIGNLDADVSFDQDYFAFLMSRFGENPRLGVAGTAFHEGDLTYNYEFVGTEHVSGMCQMFRRECFEAIGGYPALRSGGLDVIAVLSARAKGWETRTFLEKTFLHHRSQGRALHTGLRERLHTGRKDYLLGNHPMWEFFRSIYQMQRKPYVIGGLLVLGSYLWSSLRGVERTIPDELMALRQDDQKKRLRMVLQRRFPRIV